MNAKCPHCGGDVALTVPRKRTVDPARVLALLDLGATPKEIADLYGIHRQTVYQIRWVAEKGASS